MQYPNLFTGYDVDATMPYVVADDFLCTNVSTITNIQVWSSFMQNQQDTNLTFVLGIWSDALPTLAGGYSHPGALLWTETFKPGGYTYSNFANGQEFFYVPTSPRQVTPETAVYLYNFTPQNPFCQQGSSNSPMVYWLSVYAQPSIPGTAVQFGWKTTTNHFRDDAVFGTVAAAGIAGNWKELFRAGVLGAVSLEMAFLLNNGPPNPDCDPSLRPKWREPPDTSTNGLDVLATAPEIVGDDFLCHAPGRSAASPFGVRGSTTRWIRTLPLCCGSGRMCPAQPGAANAFSHPGTLLCQTEFFPPQTVGTSLPRYNYSLAAANVQENFYKPDLAGTSGFIGRDTQIWRYDFYPFQPGCWVQQGQRLGPGTTYWVTIDYLPPAGTVSPFLFGVKTSTTHLLDDAVYGHLNADNFPLGDWVDLIDPRTNRASTWPMRFGTSQSTASTKTWSTTPNPRRPASRSSWPGFTLSPGATTVRRRGRSSRSATSAATPSCNGPDAAPARQRHPRRFRDGRQRKSSNPLDKLDERQRPPAAARQAGQLPLAQRRHDFGAGQQPRLDPAPDDQRRHRVVSGACGLGPNERQWPANRWLRLGCRFRRSRSCLGPQWSFPSRRRPMGRCIVGHRRLYRSCGRPRHH